MFGNWASDYEVTKYIRFTPHKDFEDTKKIINKWINKYDAGSFNWVVELKDIKGLLPNAYICNLDGKVIVE